MEELDFYLNLRFKSDENCLNLANYLPEIYFFPVF